MNKKNVFNIISLVIMRVLGFIPILILVGISCFKLFIMTLFDYLKYGSEIIIRNSRLKTSDIKVILKKLQDSEHEAIYKYYFEVCKLAEDKMLKSGKLEGMHYSAMQEILKKYQKLN